MVSMEQPKLARLRKENRILKEDLRRNALGVDSR
jgi:hypothetical protein